MMASSSFQIPRAGGTRAFGVVFFFLATQPLERSSDCLASDCIPCHNFFVSYHVCTCVPEGWIIIRGLWEGYEGKGVKKAVHLVSRAGDEGKSHGREWRFWLHR